VDLDWKIIPGKLTAFGIILAAVFSTICPRLHSLYIGVHAGGGSWMESLGRLIAKVPQIDGLIASLGGMAAGVIVILVVRYLGTIVFRREAMGLGDARLMAVIGGFLGWRAIPVVFMLAAFVGAVIGAVSYFKTREREIPLGPFLALGALVVMLLGNELVRWWFVGLMHLDWSPQILSYSP
jgi:leader peptidase (prepilin peptidase)/N-methyltransferase